MVKDIRGGNLGSLPRNLTNVNGTLFFTADDGTHYEELWKSDGTPGGTVLVKDIRTGNWSSNPSHLTNVNGTLFFRANDGEHFEELWKSDGTTGGTVLVKDIHETGSASPTALTNVNGTLFFSANDGTNGRELWKSDGMAGGTELVKNINTGGASFPRNLTNVNGTLFFAADDGTNGFELWKSDGTDGRTVLVKDIRLGSESSDPTYLTNVDGVLFFRADDGVHGPEVWMSDGTAEGTVMVADIAAAGGSNPSFLTDVGGLFFFSADDNVHGQELWRVNRAPVADAGGPYTGLEGTSVTLDASSSYDPDGDPLQYRWDFDNSGEWDTDWSTEPTVSYAWDDDWTGWVRLEVSDGTPQTNIATAAVTIANVAPTATLSYDPVTYGQLVTVRFSAQSDPSPIDMEAGLRYAFASNPDDLSPVTYENASVDDFWEIPDLAAGEYPVHGRIIDKDDGFTQYSTTVIVDKAPLTVTAADKTKVYGADEPELTYTASGELFYGDAYDVISGVTLSTVTGAAATAGTHPILASGGMAVNYEITHVNGMLTVDQAPLTVTADNKAKVYGAEEPDLTYTPSGTLFYDDDYHDVISGVVLSTATGADATAGTHAITASGGTADNYAITHENGTLTVGQASLTVTADDKTKVYGAADPVLTYTVGGELFYGDTEAVVSGVELATVTGEDATVGTHPITASHGTADNYAITHENGTLTVGQAPLTVKADDKTKVYGAEEPELTYTASGTLFYGDQYNVITGVNLSTVTGAAATAGPHAITTSGGTADNYAITHVDGTLTVGQAPLTVTADNKAKVYGAEEPDLTYTPSGTRFYDDDYSVISGVLLSTATGTDATVGTHAITASGGRADNYAITHENGTLTVGQASLTVTADDKTKVYGAPDPVLTYTVGGELFYGDTEAVVSGVELATVTGEDATVGTHPIKASGGTADNYVITQYVDGTLTVLEAPDVTGSGNVTAAISRGSLIVTGDNQSNSIEITAGAKSGQWVITGLGDTTVNGKPQETIFDVTRDVVIRMQGGDDYVIARNAQVAQHLRVEMGAGNNRAVFESVTTAGDAVFRNGTGDDNELTMVSCIIGANLDLRGGAGSERVYFTKTEIGRDLIVNLGGGADLMLFDDGEVGRDAQITLGGGGGEHLWSPDDLPVDMQPNGDVLAMRDSQVGRHVNIQTNTRTGHHASILLQSVTTDGNAVFRNGSGGQNNLRLIASVVVENLDLRGGAGSDRMHLTSESEIQGDLIVSLGRGADWVLLDEGVVRGNARIRLGGGGGDQPWSLADHPWSLPGFDEEIAPTGDVLVVRHSQIGRNLDVQTNTRAADHATVWMFTDDDQLGPGYADDDLLTVIARDVIVQGGAGSDKIGIWGGLIQRDLQIGAGRGDDEIRLGKSSIGRHAQLGLARGSNLVEIDELSVADRFELAGGRGQDQVLVGTQLASGLRADQATFRMSSGQDLLVLFKCDSRELLVQMDAGDDRLYAQENRVTARTRLQGGRGRDGLTTDVDEKNEFAGLTLRGFTDELDDWI
jgi:ELWxxDGT repeat protein